MLLGFLAVDVFAFTTAVFCWTFCVVVGLEVWVVVVRLVVTGVATLIWTFRVEVLVVLDATPRGWTLREKELVLELDRGTVEVLVVLDSAATTRGWTLRVRMLVLELDPEAVDTTERAAVEEGVGSIARGWTLRDWMLVVLEAGAEVAAAAAATAAAT